MDNLVALKVPKTTNVPHQVTIMDFIDEINSKKDKTLKFLKSLNIYTSNPDYEIANIDVGDDWKVKKIHINKKQDNKWELFEITIDSYDYKLEPNSSYNTDDESLVTRFKWEINFKSKIKWLEAYIREILKQFHEIQRQ